MTKQIAVKNKASLIEKMAGRFSIDPSKLMDTLKATAFKQADGSAPSNEQMAALLIVADKYGLNPFTREIYAFADKRAGIVPVVGVDGWSRIINDNPQSDGFEFRESEETTTPEGGKECPNWMEIVIHRKDRAHPIIVREYIDEVYRPPFKKDDRVIPGPWQTHTKRLFRHKVLIQGARIAYGFSGIYDEDEARRIIDGEFNPTDENQDLLTRLAPTITVSDDVKNEVHEKSLAFLETGDEAGMKALWNSYDADTQVVLHKMFNSSQRSAIKKLTEAKQ